MRSNSRILSNRARSLLLGTSLLGGAAFMATAPAFAADENVETVIVTGYRASLTAATDAKRGATNFTDSIFAEDIGKFPDTNIAESLNRIPGVTISREIDGEGLNVSIRGLGTNFTKITLNNAQIAVASTGATDQRNNNREVDLNMFPTELFTQLTVSKSPTADQLEGGAAGVVNLRTQRPFDKEGFRLSYNLQGTDVSIADEPGERGALILSDTWGNFGALFGVAGVHNNVFVKGWEDGNAGWVGPSLSAAQCTLGTACGNFGSKSWGVPATIPANVAIPIPGGGGATYAPGTVIDQAFLTANNPGTTIGQLSNALLPRLGRSMFSGGTRDRYNAVASLEWRPIEGMHFYVDAIFGRQFNDLNRSDINFGVRSGAGSQPLIPTNVTIQPDWLGLTANGGGAVQSGTFYNAQFALEARPFKEKGDFYSVNPGVEWQINDMLWADIQLNATRSHFFRDSPTVFVVTCPSAGNGALQGCTPPAGGVRVDFTNAAGSPFPTIATNIDLNNPANYQWNNGRVNLQDEKRFTVTDGAHFDVKWGDESFNVQAGGAFDHAFRSIIAIDDSGRWQNAICGDNPNVYLPGPNPGLAGCTGQNVVGPAPGTTPVGFVYPPAPTSPPALSGPGSVAFSNSGGYYAAQPGSGYGTGYSTGFPALAWQGSLVPQSALASYLVKGPTGFTTVDYNKIFKASNYYTIDNNAIAAVAGCSTMNCSVVSPPFATASNTGGTSGAFDEKTYGVYLKADGVLHLGDRDLKWDAGLRWFDTHQTIISPVQHTDPRNATLLNGGLYPNFFTFAAAKNDYSAFLPNINVVYNVADDFLVRGSLSRTMTRPDPSQMISVVNFSDPTAAAASVGNPALKPFYSNNIDLGAEYYTGGEGYVSVAVFRKSLSGFTVAQNITQPFSNLAQFGINYASLTATQQAALCGRSQPICNPSTATDASVANTTLTVTEQVNSPGLKIINGIELGYVQPLDFLLEQHGLKGFGFQGNLTIIDQKATGTAPSIAVGVAPFTYNVSAYYDNDDNGISARLSYVFTDTSYASGSNQQSVCLPVGTSAGGCPVGAYLFAKAYGQADFSSSWRLSKFLNQDIPSDPELTFDVQNIFSAKQVSYFQLPDAVHSYYIKGQTYLFGLRGTF
jgi:outer membrane receptor protein involved in Fe transport